MKLIANSKLKSTQEQEAQLRASIECCIQACNRLASRAWKTQKFRPFDLHKLTIRDRLDMFDSAAQIAACCAANVPDKLNRPLQRSYRRSAQHFDASADSFMMPPSGSGPLLAGRKSPALPANCLPSATART
jgi:hypothetical protein